MMSSGFYLSFKESIENYTRNTIALDRLWNDIVNQYTEPSRHYHTLTHLDALANELTNVREAMIDWDLVVFAVAYHDIIYNPLKNDNEEKSADHAAKILYDLLNAQSLEKCRHMIMATKNHALDNDADVNYFIDADLSILGTNSRDYEIYTEQIRKEYSIYPYFIYKQGRRKVVKHFIEMNQIYKTAYFFDKYEQQAKINLANELRDLH